MEFPESKYIDTAVAVFFSFPERTWLHFVSLSKSLLLLNGLRPHVQQRKGWTASHFH